jgi:hypothetical protein
VSGMTVQRTRVKRTWVPPCREATQDRIHPRIDPSSGAERSRWSGSP